MLWLDMYVQSVQELTDRGSSHSGSSTLPLQSSLLRPFTLYSSWRQSAEAPTASQSLIPHLALFQLDPCLGKGRAPLLVKPQCGYFLFILICPQPESLLKEIFQHQEALYCTLNTSWLFYQSVGSKLWNIKTWFSHPS